MTLGAPTPRVVIQKVPIAMDLGGRVPPNNLEAEAAVLSAIMLGGDARGKEVLDEVRQYLPNPDYFYSDANRRIYAAALACQENKQPVDIQTIAAVLKDRGQIEAVGGVYYLAKIVDATPAVANAWAHAKIVREKHRVRRLIETCQEIAAAGHGDYGEAKEFIDRAEQRVYELANEPEEAVPSQMYDLCRERFNYEETILKEGGGRQGIAFGFRELDERTGGGARARELTIVAARPSMGKTALVLSYAVNMARETQVVQEVDGREIPVLDSDGNQIVERTGVVLFSLEMEKEQILMRMVASRAQVDLQRSFQPSRLSSADYDKRTNAFIDLSKLPLWIEDVPCTLLDVRSKVRRLQRQFNTDARGGDPRRPGEATEAKSRMRIGTIIIDYLQMLRPPPGVFYATREQQIADVGRGLKELAKELNVAVIAVATLNRDLEKRARSDRRPQMSDLRESGELEYVADLIQFVYRPAYYITDKASDEYARLKNYAEVIIGKQRNGPTGRVSLNYEEQYVRFSDRGENDPVYDGD